jgi:uridine kinase
MLKVILNDDFVKEYKKGTKFLDIYEDLKDNINLQYFPYAVLVNNNIKSISDVLDVDSKLAFLDYTNVIAQRIYENSLIMILNVAVKAIFGPKADFKIDHSYGPHLYGRFYVGKEVTTEDIYKIRKKMFEIRDADIPIKKIELDFEEAIDLFNKNYREDVVRLLQQSNFHTLFVYKCANVYDFFYSPVLPSTGYVKNFDLINYAPGFLLLRPDRNNPNKIADLEESSKMFQSFQEYRRWSEILGIKTVADLNDMVMSKDISTIIKVAEAMHERKLSFIADEITKRKDDIKLVLIAGPSSSGKTTSSKKLMVELMVNGIKPITISLDDYFKNREDTPRDEKGEPDFDCIDALDLKLFNQHLTNLIEGKEIELPKYNFKTGHREKSGKKLRLYKNQLVIIEGTHGLNPKLTYSVPGHRKYRIYVSALTQLNLDNHNRIPTTDTRLVRRIVRDGFFRGYDAQKTIHQWPMVRRGEDKYIFPFQETADIFYNSALPYELSVLKNFGEFFLRKVKMNSKEYSEAKRLLTFLSYFITLTPEEIPPTSIIREFIGGSSFNY